MTFAEFKVIHIGEGRNLLTVLRISTARLTPGKLQVPCGLALANSLWLWQLRGKPFGDTLIPPEH